MLHFFKIFRKCFCDKIKSIFIPVKAESEGTVERNCYGSNVGPGGVTISAGCSVDDATGDKT